MGVSVSGPMFLREGVCVRMSLSRESLYRGSLYGGVSVQGNLCHGEPLTETPRRVKRSVCILLECFLVRSIYSVIVPLKFAASRCAFAARGLCEEKTIDSSPILFQNVDLNICNAYNATTGEHQMYVGKFMKVQESIPIGCLPPAPDVALEVSQMNKFELVSTDDHPASDPAAV